MQTVTETDREKATDKERETNRETHKKTERLRAVGSGAAGTASAVPVFSQKNGQ